MGRDVSKLWTCRAAILLVLPARLHLSVAAVASASAADGSQDQDAANAWRLVNTEEVEVAWRIRGLQFFSTSDCASTSLLDAVPEATGNGLATPAGEGTGVEHIFEPRTMRGWESHEHCAVGECHVGFDFGSSLRAVRCLLIQQGEDGFFAPGMALQRREESTGTWVEVVRWTGIPVGRAKLAVECPSAPEVRRGKVSACEGSALEKRCTVSCDDGFGAVEPQMRCHNGAWYAPECLAVGSMVRIVATAPERIKPYWVILDATLYADEACTEKLDMKGSAFSSGEFVIKYASYSPSQAFDGDTSTSWAAKETCSPGSCYVGFRFRKAPERPPRCVVVEHPQGSEYHASAVALQHLGPAGWEDVPDAVVRLLPEREEL